METTPRPTPSLMGSVRRWCRTLHRDLSYIFSGVLLVYAASGFMLNHKADFNSNYDISHHSYTVAVSDIPEEVTDDYARSLLVEWGVEDKFSAVFDLDDERFKVFIGGGSSLVVNRTTGEALYECIRKRPVLSKLNRLHYNPTRWWTWFSDIFLASLVVIIITGLIMVKGSKGLWGRGGIELIAGIIIPLLFIFLS